MRNVYDMILAPVVTEKTAEQMEAENVYTFIVAENANKIEIGKAVERIWDVTVQDVRTMRYAGKVSAPSWAACRGTTRRAAPLLQEGRRAARRGRPHRALRGGLTMGIKKFRPMTPGNALALDPGQRAWSPGRGPRSR